MAAFNFPDPATGETTVTNPITGSTYQWQDPPGKWVVIVKMREIGDIIWEGDSPPDPVGDYKLWYSTDTLELYFYYTDANGNSAWLPTSKPISMLDDLDTALAEVKQDVVAANVAINENENRIDSIIFFGAEEPIILADDTYTDAEGNVTTEQNKLNYKFWLNTTSSELSVLRIDDDAANGYSYKQVSGKSTLQEVCDNGNTTTTGATFEGAVMTERSVTVFEEKELVSREFVDKENELQDETVQRELDNINERIDELVGSSIMAHYTMGNTSYPTLGNVCMFSVAESSDVQYLTLNWGAVKELSFNPKDADNITHDLNNIRPYDVVRFVGSTGTALFRVSRNDGGGFLLISETLVSTGSAKVGERYAVEFLPGFDPSAYATKSYVDDKFQDAMPIGSIVFWGGTRAKIPAGWKECDGSTAPSGVKDFTGMDKLPDLRDYMPAGAGGKFGSTVGAKYGSRLQKHTHTVTRLEPHSTTGNPDDAAGTSSSRYRYWRGNSKEDGSSGNLVPKVSSENPGSDFNAPPVYAGIYIMKVQ